MIPYKLFASNNKQHCCFGKMINAQISLHVFLPLSHLRRQGRLMALTLGKLLCTDERGQPFSGEFEHYRGHLPLCHPSAQPGSLHPHPIADSCCWGLPRPPCVCVHGMGAEGENPAGSFLPSHEHPLHYLLVSSWGFCSISPPKKRPVLL